MSKKKALSFSQCIKRFPNKEACVKYLYAVKFNRRKMDGDIFDRFLVAIAG